MSSILIKNDQQIEGIRKSSKLAAKTLTYIAPFVKEGVSTEFLDRKIEEFIRDHGATPSTLYYYGYPKSCCISINEVVCHGIPSERTLKDGDILNIDVTTTLNGYFGDTSRMYTVGEISEEAKRLISATKKALEIGIAEVRPGNRFGNIGYRIARFIDAQGFSVVYEYCGHGVGLKMHETPNVEHIARENSGSKMKPGMIFTIEPMINAGVPETSLNREDGWTASTKDGKLSAQFEHTILVTGGGCEILTVDGSESIKSGL